MKEKIAEGFVVFREDHTKPPLLKSYIYLDGGEVDEAENLGQKQVMGSVFYRHSQPSNDWMKNLFGEKAFENPKDHEVLGRLIRYVASKNALTMDFFAGSGSTAHAIIQSNREDGGRRKYILVEMEEYFDTVMKPRIQKAVYSKDWKDGKPISREGTSHIFKYMKLESYEDTLNNIAFTHETDGQEALKLYGDDYLLRYMLDFETRGSETLLNMEKLSAPFSYKLILHESGESREVPVDLPETFAYLLGMRVKSRKVYHDSERRYLTYRGSTPERDNVTVIWRDTEGWAEEDFKRDRDFVRESGMVEDANEVFVNGDSYIPEVRPLEGVFKQRMLAEPVSG
jgi:adenine-specific DNA-methyltransferase